MCKRDRCLENKEEVNIMEPLSRGFILLQEKYTLQAPNSGM